MAWYSVKILRSQVYHAAPSRAYNIKLGVTYNVQSGRVKGHLRPKRAPSVTIMVLA